MNYVTPMHRNAEAGFPISGSGEDGDRFSSDLADGLHAMAQPLTILRSTMEALKFVPATDQQRYLEISARQVERTCWLFSCMQDLVSAQRSEADRKPFDLRELVGPRVEEHRKQLAAAGIGLVFTEAESTAPVCGDAERTDQAVDAILRIAGAVSSRGDVIEMRTAHRKGFVEVTFENCSRHGKSANASDRFGLAVAEANILSQQGLYTFIADPFCVSVALPNEEIGATDGGLCVQGMQHVH